MDIYHSKYGKKLNVKLNGILNYDAADELRDFFENRCEAVNEVDIDMSEMDYISSAGMRVILEVALVMQKRGGIVLRQVNDTVHDALKIAGFDRFLKIVD